MTNNPHILVADDDKDIRDLLAKYLGENNFTTTVAKNGTEMLEVWQQGSIDLIILDVMMPGENGFDLCRKIRATSKIPIIMLTAVDTEIDTVLGLELGADDYITKPFNPRELLARIKAVLRRHATTDTETVEQETYCFDDWCLTASKRQLINPAKQAIELSTGEYDLLFIFLQHPQRVLSRDQLLDLTRNRQHEPFDRSIDIQVSRLRQKIETNPKQPQLIKTVRGGGYMFTAKVERH